MIGKKKPVTRPHSPPLNSPTIAASIATAVTNLSYSPNSVFFINCVSQKSNESYGYFSFSAGVSQVILNSVVSVWFYICWVMCRK